MKSEEIYNIAKTFSCPNSNKVFSTSSKMRIHEITHTNEKPFKCSQCDKKFAQEINLKKHEKKHKEEKPSSSFLQEIKIEPATI